MQKDKVTNIVVIGASAGGISAVARLCAHFDATVDAAVFIVIHLAKDASADVVLFQIKKSAKLTCKIPVDGEKIQNGYIYLAPPDHHIMLRQGEILVKKGPHENHWRPSIDVLFRTAAAAYDSCVTGIILTGMLDDGTSGMAAIKKSGGRCYIQDPEEAEYPEMPISVLNNIAVDLIAPLNEIGHVVSDLHSREGCDPNVVPNDVKLEADITLRMASNVEDQLSLGTQIPLTCPSCGGTLVLIENEERPRYRCYTGHSFSQRSLAIEQQNALENSIWVAIRMMEERRNLLTSTFIDDRREERATQLNIHIKRLKEMLLQMGEDTTESKINENLN